MAAGGTTVIRATRGTPAIAADPIQGGQTGAEHPGSPDPGCSRLYLICFRENYRRRAAAGVRAVGAANRSGENNEAMDNGSGGPPTGREPAADGRPCPSAAPALSPQAVRVHLRRAAAPLLPHAGEIL